MSDSKTHAVLAAVPILPAVNVGETLQMFTDIGADETVHHEEYGYGLVFLGSAELHFFTSDDRKLAESSSCKINVSAIDELYERCMELGIVHPNGRLAVKPWGAREFAILDTSGVCYTFTCR